MSSRHSAHYSACRKALFILLAGAATQCSVDSRSPQVVAPLGPTGSDPAPPPVPEPTALAEMASGLSLSRRELDLGAAVTGFAAFGRLTLNNAGTEPLALSNVSLDSAGDANFQIAQNQCLAQLSGGASCDVRIQLLPTKLGPIESTLLVQTEAGSTRVPLHGRGLQPGSLVVSPAPGATPDFGGVLLGERSQAVFRITNPLPTDSGPLTLEAVQEDFALEPALEGDCSSGQTSLSNGASCNVRISFAPTHRGPVETTLSVTSQNLGSASLALSGDGKVAGGLAVSAQTLSFPGVVLAGVGTATLSLRNIGDAPISLGPASIQGENAAEFTLASTDCGEGTLLGGAAAASCSIDVEFRPTSAGSRRASLLVTADGGQQVVALEGEGLLPGSLTLSAAGEMSADFGDVLVGQSLVRRFTIGNPGTEASGSLKFLGANDFAVLGPSESGDCESDVTNLSAGGSCSLALQLTPSERGTRHGTLTVVSELAGSSSLPVSGRGILAAHLAAAREEVNFGGVVRGSSAADTLVLSNDGDLPLPALEASLDGSTSADAAAFSFENGCSEPLAPAAQCEIALRFAPERAAALSVTLRVASSNGDSAGVLLRGVGLEPGSLVITPAEGPGTDFGDVAIGSSVLRQFSITNPGNIASGLLSIASSSARFVVSEGSCADLSAAGLVDGDSCDFNVRFTPVSSDPVSANLLVSSAGAGSAGRSVVGRGRRPVSLSGSNVFDYATVIVSDTSGARRWTVTNDGDLATGTLVTSGASREFAVSNDTCNGRSLPGGAQCRLDVSFVPQGTGLRSSSISLTDPASNSSASLSVRGVGQNLPDVGEGCLNGRCAAGSSCENSSSGVSQVCCGADCTGTQRCSASQSFDACELPSVGAGAACSASVLCRQGLTCSAPTQPGRCCPSDCTGSCSVCNTDGSCSTVRDGQQGRCGNAQECRAGACVNKAPARLLADTALLDFGSALIGASAGNRQWTISNTGGLPTGTISVSAPADFSATGPCVGGTLAAGSSCTLTISFRPSVPGNRSGTLTLNAGTGVSTSVSVSGLGDCGATRVAVRVGTTQQCRTRTGSSCTQSNQCQDGFCRTWFLDLDSDGWGGTETTQICGNSTATPPPSVIRPTNRGEATFNYVSIGGDCCDFLQQNAAGRSLPPNNVNPGVSQSSNVAATLCPVPGDLNCDGVVITGVGRRIEDSVFVDCPFFVPGGDRCENHAGYSGPPTCGEVASIIDCRTQPDGSCQQVNPINGGPADCL